MTTSTLLIIGAAVVLLALILLILARTGRKTPEGPADEDGIAMVRPATALSPPPETPFPPTVEEPAAAAEPVPLVAGPSGPPDPLTRLKGLGPKAEAILNGLGITRYEQLAGLAEADIQRLDERMGAFKGRILRDRWVEQARLLATGDTAGFEQTFGKLG